MDVITWRLIDNNRYLHNRLEDRDYDRNDTGDNDASPDKNDSSNRHGRWHCIDPAGKYMQRKTDAAHVLSKSYIHFFIFYDSLYAQTGSEKAYSLYSFFVFGIFNHYIMTIGGN